MRNTINFLLLVTVGLTAGPALADTISRDYGIQLGPRPEYLVNDMQDSALKNRLLACLDKKPQRTLFSIGHRGAPLQFPEHTYESYRAGARMGAGILECDVTFTKDKELVCRHSQNDLATTTNILLTPLAETCIKPFTPAVIASDGTLRSPAGAECRTSEITLAEFKSLRGKMDASDPRARTPEEFVNGTASFRTDLYAGPTSGTLITHGESIALFQELGVAMTPELKSPRVKMPFDGFTRAQFAQKLIDAYRAASVPPGDVWPQSFNRDDVLYWVENEAEFGKQAVLLEGAGDPGELPGPGEIRSYAPDGINFVSAPLYSLLALDASNAIVPSEYAQNLAAEDIGIITWTLERSGILADGDNGYYYQTIDPAISRDGDVMEVIDVLAREVGVIGIFSDWPAPVSFYASCMNLE